MIKTSMMYKISVDDVRQIPHLTAIGMMTIDILKFDYIMQQDFINMLNNYVMRCNPKDKSLEYYVKDSPNNRVVFSPAGFDGIKVEYNLGYTNKIVYWDIEDYAELSGEQFNVPEDDDEDLG